MKFHQHVPLPTAKLPRKFQRHLSKGFEFEIQQAREPDRCPFRAPSDHRSHFGSRYQLGRCALRSPLLYPIGSNPRPCAFTKILRNLARLRAARSPCFEAVQAVQKRWKPSTPWTASTCLGWLGRLRKSGNLGGRTTCQFLKKLTSETGPSQGSNRWDTKEGCAERIARVGTLSQNGYGDCKMREKRAYQTRRGTWTAPRWRDTSSPSAILRRKHPIPSELGS